MTNFERARYIINFATAVNMGLNCLDIICEYPVLKDDECVELSKESIYSRDDIRRTFPTEAQRKAGLK